MSYEAKSVMRWIGAVLAVVVLAAVIVMIWNVHAHKRITPPVVTAVRSTGLVASTSQKPGPKEAPEIPKLVPGDTCEKASELYGAPDEKDQYVRTWRKKDFTVYASGDSKCVLTSIVVAVVPGHKALTQDGITLGKDTLADAKRIFQSRINASASVDAPEGNWEGVITLKPTATAQFTVTYRAKFDSKKAEQMNRDPNFEDVQGQIVTDYSLDLAAPGRSTK